MSWSNPWNPNYSLPNTVFRNWAAAPGVK
jgi:hypothetical protein